jgi:hypothetical protein
MTDVSGTARHPSIWGGPVHQSIVPPSEILSPEQGRGRSRRRRARPLAGARRAPAREAPPDRVVLRLEPPQPREPVPCRAPHGKAAWADVYPKGLRGFSTRLAYCSGGPVSGPPRLLRSSPHPPHGLYPAYTPSPSGRLFPTSWVRAHHSTLPGPWIPYHQGPFLSLLRNHSLLHLLRPLLVAEVQDLLHA